MDINLKDYLKNIRSKIINEKSFLFCKVRKKYVAVTPEELVRQSMLQFLHHEFHVSYALMKVEYFFGKNDERLDIAVFNSEGKAQIIVECKAPQVSLGEETVQQLSRYNSYIKAPKGIITNGIKTIFLNFEV